MLFALATAGTHLVCRGRDGNCLNSWVTHEEPQKIENKKIKKSKGGYVLWVMPYYLNTNKIKSLRFS